MPQPYGAFGETPLERPNWFEGRLITPEDLDLEQTYLRERQRRRNRLLVGWGVVTGLGVTVGEPGTIVVSPGFALDVAGNEILVQDETVVDADRAGLDHDRHPQWLAIRWDEEPSGELPADQPDVPARTAAWRESFELALLPDEPVNGLTGGPEPTTPWLALATVTWDDRVGLSVDPAIRREIALPINPAPAV